MSFSLVTGLKLMNTIRGLASGDHSTAKTPPFFPVAKSGEHFPVCPPDFCNEKNSCTFVCCHYIVNKTVRQSVFKKKILILETGGSHKINKKREKGRFLSSLVYPLGFVLLIWTIKAVQLVFDLEFYRLGIYPQSLEGLKGIVFSPFIHGSSSHLASNSLPLLILGTGLFYFYRTVAFRVVLWSVLITGFWVWIIGRPSYHIGASGILYSLASFLFVSGMIRRHPRLMALSLLVSFLYGSMVWGVFPIRDGMSWESHLMGAISGIVLALFFRSHGPQRPLYSWELEEEEEEEEETGIPVGPGDEGPGISGGEGGGPEPEPEPWVRDSTY